MELESHHLEAESTVIKVGEITQKDGVRERGGPPALGTLIFTVLDQAS